MFKRRKSATKNVRSETTDKKSVIVFILSNFGAKRRNFLYYQIFAQTEMEKSYYQILPPKAVIVFATRFVFKMADLRIHM